MRDKALSIDAIMANGEKLHFGPVDARAGAKSHALSKDLLALGTRTAQEIDAHLLERALDR